MGKSSVMRQSQVMMSGVENPTAGLDDDEEFNTAEKEAYLKQFN